MTPSSRLVFFGTEAFSVPTLQSLIAAGYSIVAIVTKPDSRRGRGKKTFIHPIKQIGLDHGIPVLQPEKVGELEHELRELTPDAAILVSYGKIIPERILNVFEPIGIINIHPSLLPRYRGPSPIEAAILAGDKITGVSIMKLDAGMDTGPIFAQRTTTLTGIETKPELSQQLAITGAELLMEVLPDILSGTLQPEEQQNNDVSVTSLVQKKDGKLDPLTDTAYALDRKVRAYQDYPKPHLTIADNDVIVTSAKIASLSSNDQLVIACAGNTYLEIETLIAPSGRNMSGSDFVRGYINRPKS